MASTLESRTITVPSIVDYYTDEELNSEYHAKAEYEQAIEKYGAIYKILDLNNSGMSAQDMQEFVREWIRKHYFDGVLSFTVKGVDLHLLGYNKDKLSIGDRIPVEFLDVYKTPVTKVLTCISAQYDILNPGNSTYKIGIPDVSMDVKLPNKNRGSSVNKSSSSYSSSGSAGTSNLYKYYKELDTKAQIQAEEIEFLAQNISLHADNIDYITNGVEGVQQSAIIQNEGEVVEVVGSFDVKDNYYGDWPEWDSSTAYKKGARVSYNNGTMGYICLKDIPEGARIPLSNTEYWLKSTGRKAVIFKDGAQAVIDDVNGQQVSVGTKLGEHDDYITTFEGSALWTQRDNITGVCGEYDVVLDPVTGKKTLVIKAGGGIKIRKNGTEFGLYDEDSLTGGIMTKKINTNGLPKWTKNTHYSVGKKINYNLQSYICIEDHDSTDVFDPSKWNEYDPTETKILGDVVEIEGSDHVSISVSDKINSQDTVINGVSTKVETFEGSELWSDRNNIVNVCGEYDVITDPSTGVKTLVIKSGGGLKIRRNNTEFGLYDEGSLTAGIMVDRINARNWTPWAEGTQYAVGDKVTINNTGYICNTAHTATSPIDMSKWTYSTNTKIKGDVVDIEARQVRVGDTTNVDAWMTETGGNLDDLSGLVADKITAYEARFHNIESDYLTSADITTDKLKAKISTMDIVTVQSLQFANGTTPYGQINFTNIRQAVRQYRVVQDGEYYKLQTKTLQASDWSDDPDSVPFKRATSVTVTGTWSGATYTVTGASNTLTTTLYNKIDPGALTLNNVAYSKMYHDNPNIDTNQVGDTLTLTLGENVSNKYVDLYTGSDSTKIQKAKISTIATYNSGWNTARGLTFNNLPLTDIGSVIGYGYETISIKYPNQNGDSTLNSQNYTMSLNTDFVPQDQSAHLIAAELKTNSNTVARIEVPTETKSITTNGTYTPSTGKLGFTSVTVNVPQGYTSVGSKFDSASGGYFITATDKSSGNSIPDSSTSYKLGTSGSTSSTKVQIQNTSGTRIDNTAELSVGSLYTNGQAAVTLNDPTYNSVSSLTGSRTITVSTNGRPTQLSKSVTVVLSNGSWSSGSIPTYIRINSATGDAIAQGSISMPEVSSTTWTNTTGRTWRADLSIGGVTRSSSTKNFDSYYSDGQSNGWSTAVGKVQLPGSGTSASMSVTTPGSAWNTSGATTYTVSADNLYAYVKISGTTTTVARASHSAYSNGQNSVTVSSVEFDGTSYDYTWDSTAQKWYINPNLKGTASNGATKSNRKNFYIQEFADYIYTGAQNNVTLNNPSWNSVSTLTSSRTVTVSTSGRGTQLSKSKTVHIAFGSWSSGTMPVYIREDSTSGTIVAQSSVIDYITVLEFNNANYSYNSDAQGKWYITQSLKAGTYSGVTRTESKNFYIQEFAEYMYEAAYQNGWNGYYNDANWGFETDTGRVYRPAQYGTGGNETWFNVSDYGWTKSSYSHQTSIVYGGMTTYQAGGQTIYRFNYYKAKLLSFEGE